MKKILLFLGLFTAACSTVSGYEITNNLIDFFTTATKIILKDIDSLSDIDVT